jgi:hypothetical protein
MRENPQRILVMQQRKRGESKIIGIKKYGGGKFEIKVVSISNDLPPVIDDTSEYLPEEIEADLVLDYLCHPDLSHDLALKCRDMKIPVIASGKRISEKSAITPPTCCGLAKQDGLGSYGLLFGMPEYQIHINNGTITDVRVHRGAPCGASWDAARGVVGMTPDAAIDRIGLETQYFCTADPSAWDPIYGKSPVHRAAEFHKAALILAIKRSCVQQVGS